MPRRIALLTVGGLIADAAAARCVTDLPGRIAFVALSPAARGRSGMLPRARRHARQSGLAFLTYLSVAHALGPLWPGTGGGRSPESLAAACSRHGIPLIPCRDVNGSAFRRTLDDHRVDLIVTACCDQILSAETVAAVRHGAVNIHPAPLPGYRGPCPLIDMAVDDCSDGAVTVHRIEDEGIDTGPVLARKPVSFPDGASILARERLAYLQGVGLLKAVLDDLPGFTRAAQPQGPGRYRSFPDRRRLAELRARGIPLWRWSDLSGPVSRLQARG